MKVILVNPGIYLKLHAKTMSMPHIGIGYLLACLKREGYDATALDGKFTGESNLQIIRKILEIKPDVIGITSMTPDIHQAEIIAKNVKKLLPNTTVVIGGAHVLGVRERVLEECVDFDLAVSGEGEYILIKILKELENNNNVNLSKISRVIYRKDSNLFFAKEKTDWIDDLDALPFPYWEGFPPSTDYPIMLSRGCPYQCIFCMRSLGSKLRKRNPEKIVEELEIGIKKLGARYFQFVDETFGIDIQWTKMILELMIKKGLGNKIRWAANSRVNIADFEIYKMMKAAGCIHIGFGIESGNQQILDVDKKGFRLEEAFNAVDLAKKAGIETSTFFIIGHPNETIDTVWDTIRFAAKLNSTEVAFGLMVPYPGTLIYEMAKQNRCGYELLSEDWSRYTKYSGNVLRVGKLSAGQLNMLQIIGYLYFYIYNKRWRDFLLYFADIIKDQYSFSMLLKHFKM